MGLGSFLKSVAGFALPVLGSIIAPGIGTALGSTLSAGTLGALGGAAGGALGSKVSGGNLLTGTALGGLGGYVYGSGGLNNAIGNTLNSSTVGAGNSAYDYLDALQGSAPAGASSSISSALGGGIGSLMGYNTGASGLLGGSGGSGISSLLSGAMASNALSSAKSAYGSALSPYASTGTAANNEIASMLGLDGKSSSEDILKKLQSTPGYQFQQQQGQQALDRSLAAKGMGFSGAALKAASNYNTNLANTYYKDYLNQLQNQSTQGLAASSALGSANANYAVAKNKALSDAFSGILNPVRYY